MKLELVKVTEMKKDGLGEDITYHIRKDDFTICTYWTEEVALNVYNTMKRKFINGERYPVEEVMKTDEI